MAVGIGISPLAARAMSATDAVLLLSSKAYESQVSQQEAVYKMHKNVMNALSSVIKGLGVVAKTVARAR